MYLYEEMDFSMFCSRFKDYGRQDFSNEGLRELFTYLEEIAEGTDSPVEVDIIALCCEFAEDKEDEVLSGNYINTFEELSEETWATQLDNGNILYMVY